MNASQVAVAFEEFIPSDHLGIVAVADLVPRAQGIWPAVGTKLVFCYDALKVELAETAIPYPTYLRFLINWCQDLKGALEALSSQQQHDCR